MRTQVLLTLPREAVSVPLARHTVSAALQRAGIEQHVPVTDLPDPSSEGGRGAALMQALTDHTAFDAAADGGGSVHLMKHLKWAATAPIRRGECGLA